MKHRHTSRVELTGLVFHAVERLEMEFETLEHSTNELKNDFLTHNDARLQIVQAAEMRAIPSCDILTVLNEFRNLTYEDFRSPNRWSLLNAFTETAKKYTPPAPIAVDEP